MQKAFPVPTNEVAIRSISTALKHHVEAQTLSDAELAEKYPCSNEDMWRKPSTFAVKRRGAKRALRVMESKDALWKWAEERHILDSWKGKKRLLRTHVWEERPGECTRCKHYCKAKDFCHQYQQILNQEQEEERQKQHDKKETKKAVSE